MTGLKLIGILLISLVISFSIYEGMVHFNFDRVFAQISAFLFFCVLCTNSVRYFTERSYRKLDN